MTAPILNNYILLVSAYNVSFTTATALRIQFLGETTPNVFRRNQIKPNCGSLFRLQYNDGGAGVRIQRRLVKCFSTTICPADLGTIVTRLRKKIGAMAFSGSQNGGKTSFTDGIDPEISVSIGRSDRTGFPAVFPRDRNSFDSVPPGVDHTARKARRNPNRRTTRRKKRSDGEEAKRPQ